jgi:hypothetical protein
MSDSVSAREFRRLANKAKKPRKKASPEQKQAETSDRATHSLARRALELAGFSPDDGYVLERRVVGHTADLGPHTIYVVAPLGVARHD